MPRALLWSLCGIFLALEAVVAVRTGVVYDEPPHIASGFVYWKAGLGLMSGEHPPLTDYLRGLALLPQRPSLPPPGLVDGVLTPHIYGQLFLFHNRVPADRLLRAARAVSILLGLLLVGLLAWWARLLGGEPAALAAAFFFIFESNMMAHSALATTEIGLAVFSTAALAALSLYLTRGEWTALVGAGLAVGAASSSKATGLGLLPVAGMTLAWRGHRRKSARDFLVPLAAVGALTALAILALYGRELGRFVEMVNHRRLQMGEATPVFFFGANYPGGHALYFPAAFLVKTSIPLLGLFACGLFSPTLRRRHPEAWLTVGAAVAVLSAAALSGRRQSGIRYLLIFYPLFCLIAGVAAADLWRRLPRLRAGLLAAAVWHAGGALSVFPHPLAYFNLLAGGSRRGYLALGDSNLDWGQSAPEIKPFLAANPGGLILSYFGTDCPRRYGLVYQEAFCTPGVCSGSAYLLPVDAGKEWLIVSATKWQGYYEPGTPAFAWLRSRRPAALLGYNMLAYDVSDDAPAHRELAAMYERGGRPDAARRERLRAEYLRRKAGELVQREAVAR